MKISRPYLRPDGRQQVIITKDDGSKTTKSYPRLLLEDLLGRPLLPEETVDHIDGDFTNNSPENLRVLSRAENSSWAWKTGNCKPFPMKEETRLKLSQERKGVNNQASKLTEDQVLDLRTREKYHGCIRDWTIEFKVSRKTIYNVLHNLTYQETAGESLEDSTSSARTKQTKQRSHKMSNCQELGYKVGDEFIVQEDGCGFVEGQVIKLYRDDGSSCPLFQGKNKWYKLCDNQEGAYFSLNYVVKLVKQEEKEMFDTNFDMQTQPWFIRVANEQEYNAARKWLDENFGHYLDNQYSTYIVGLTNTDDYGNIDFSVTWIAEHSLKATERYEIKLFYKTVVDSVQYPQVETEQDKKIRELRETIEKAQKQIEDIQKGMK